MGKPRDTKVAILPSTTRKGTTLSTSAALDSPSVIDKLVSPPHASNAGTSAESENSHNIDNISAVLDDSGSLGTFLDASIARSRQIENTETPDVTTPVNSPELEYSSDDLDEDYVELDDDFIEKCHATTDARKIKKLLAEHAVRYKLSPDPKFATSPINIRDKDYDFSLDLSHIAIVEKTPFCGTEKESAVEHMTELSTLSSLFSDDEKNSSAEELLAKIGRNYDDWTTPEPTPTPIVKKRGLIKLNDEDMREAKKSLKEKGIKSEDVKNLPPIEDICEIIPPSSMIEVNSLQRFTREDIPYSKPPAQCLDEFDNYIVKQENFNMRVENHLMENSQAISQLHDIVERTSNDVKMLVKHFHMVQTQIDQLTKVQNDLLGNNSKEKHAYEVTTRGGVSTQDPLYPEGHPKRIEQDSQRIEPRAHSKKKKKKHKNVVESSEPVNDPNSISISDAETESGNEHEKDNDKNDTPDKEEVEEEPEKHTKNKKYTKEDFIAEKHVPISPEIPADDSDFSSSNEEFSSTRFIDTKASGKLTKIISNTSFESSADSIISSDSDNTNSFNFIDKSAAIGRVFTNLYDGVTNPDKNQYSKYHQVYAIEEASRAEPETSEAFDDLGNSYVDSADLRRGLGTKYVGTTPRDPEDWLVDYLEMVKLVGGTRATAMQSIQVHLSGAARSWIKKLPPGSIDSWGSFEDIFVKNFRSTCKKPASLEELRACRQKHDESMRKYIQRWNIIKNSAEDISDERAIDAFVAGIRRADFVEDLGRTNPKTISALMEIANKWADGEDAIYNKRHRSPEEDRSRSFQNRRRFSRQFYNNDAPGHISAGFRGSPGGNSRDNYQK
ncbi:hypothetical protein QYE76_001858 [Lolium multiflorum]|uniref:Retrotransposon gag domain-containing protein n=1 Tax=Lolium multiflorum TaxID=4521 RepID=A0AAD8VZR4_LOLMU|nr:hypothetical protein QYE76_001858 [Lolium multiflorum]